MPSFDIESLSLLSYFSAGAGSGVQLLPPNLSVFLPTPMSLPSEAEVPYPLTLSTCMAADLAEACGAGTGVILATGQTQVGAASVVVPTAIFSCSKSPEQEVQVRPKVCKGREKLSLLFLSVPATSMVSSCHTGDALDMPA